MPNFDVVLANLREERERISQVIAALEAVNRKGGSGKRVGMAKRTLSPAARKRIATAQRARWAKWRRTQKAS